MGNAIFRPVRGTEEAIRKMPKEDGYIYYEGGKIKVETILAWGEIYRPHYRVLVH